MTFTISNREIENSQKIDDIYIVGDFIEKDSNFLLFEGDLYPENNYSKEDLLEKLIKEEEEEVIKNLKGYFCGVFYNSADRKLLFFNDKLGIYDMFYYRNDAGQLIVSDRFINIIKVLDLNFEDIDVQALVEFLIFEYPLFGKTFIRNVRNLPMASIYRYDCETNCLNTKSYGDYEFKVNSELNFEQSIEKFDQLFDKAMRRIKGMFPNDTVFGLGLSGGMDSRLIAHYAKKNNMKLEPFIIGDPKSDAYFISQKIAKALELNLHELGYDRDFIRYAEESIQFNPMMSILYCWYYSVYDRLPRFDILLTGFHGDDQLGSHLKKEDFLINNDQEALNSIYLKYDESRCLKAVKSLLINDQIITRIEKDILNFLANSINKEYWQKKEEFNYKFRQRVFIKNNPLFNFFGQVKSISPFTDLDLIEFLMKIPFEWRLNRKFYYEFFRKKVPNLAKIRLERQVSFSSSESIFDKIKRIVRYLDTNILRTHIFYKRSHKDVFNWIKNNKFFDKYVDNIISRENKWFNLIFKKDKVIHIKKNLTKNNYHLFLRILTIKLFLDFILKKKR